MRSLFFLEGIFRIIQGVFLQGQRFFFSLLKYDVFSRWLQGRKGAQKLRVQEASRKTSCSFFTPFLIGGFVDSEGTSKKSNWRCCNEIFSIKTAPTQKQGNTYLGTPLAHRLVDHTSSKKNLIQDEGEGDESEKDDDDVKVMVVDGIMLEKRHLGVSRGLETGMELKTLVRWRISFPVRGTGYRIQVLGT